MSSVTQIIYFNLNPNNPADLEDTGVWAEALDICEQAPGFQMLYWGRSHEHPTHVQLHVGDIAGEVAGEVGKKKRDNWDKVLAMSSQADRSIVRSILDDHKSFLTSPAYTKFLSILQSLSASSEKPTIRHVSLETLTPNNPSLTPNAPFTGTAIYYNNTDVFDSYAWPLWSHIVRHLDGCLGCTGGKFLDESIETVPGPLGDPANGTKKEKFRSGHLVYVGWESTEAHHNVHKSEEYRKYGPILKLGNDGFAEYGHICFQGERPKGGVKL